MRKGRSLWFDFLYIFMLYPLFCSLLVSLLCVKDRGKLQLYLLQLRQAGGSCHFHPLVKNCSLKILSDYSGQCCYLLSKGGSTPFWFNGPDSECFLPRSKLYLMLQIDFRKPGSIYLPFNWTTYCFSKNT